jgi:hypothetical protein
VGQHPELAREFQSKTPKGAVLPEHVGHNGKRKKQDKTASSLVSNVQYVTVQQLLDATCRRMPRAPLIASSTYLKLLS